MPRPANAAFVIKAEIYDLDAVRFTFAEQKTMYGGKLISAGDMIFLFASETRGGQGLFARGVVALAEPIANKPGVQRQTPRVSVTVERLARAKQRLGRIELKSFRNWDDGLPQSELNFKLYRQATDKIVGVTASTAAYLDGFF